MKAICPNLDADIEEEQGGWDMILRQPHFAERAGKSKAVEQTEAKGHDPGRLRGDSASSFASVNNLGCHKNDR